MLIKDQLKPHKTSADAAEIAHFNALAEEWWKEDGAFKTAHAFNNTRIEYLSKYIPKLFERDIGETKPLNGLSILDVGCGAGLVSEALFDLGADITGIDASELNINVAKHHAEALGKKITYHHALPETLVKLTKRYDLVLTLEVVEHVSDVDLFLSSCAALVNDNGAMIVGTINRTLRSFIKAIIGAEYVLGWLPKGTHNWRKFVTPNELETCLSKYDLAPDEMCGVQLNPFTRNWYIAQSFDTTYLQAFQKNTR